MAESTFNALVIDEFRSQGGRVSGPLAGTPMIRRAHFQFGATLPKGVRGQVDVSAPGAPLVPPVSNLRASSATTAVAVAQAAIDDGVATSKPGNLVQAVQDTMWQPAYPDA